MWIKIQDLKNWYQTEVGRMAKRVLRRKLRRLLPVQPPEKVLVMGYGFPYMRLFLNSDVVHLCPESIGCMRFPESGQNKAFAAYPDELPFKEDTFDYIFMAHGLEFSDNPHKVMEETWRVLKAQGKLLVMAPNRLSPWSRIEETPFAKGKPYSSRELTELFKSSDYQMTQSAFGLYFPPSSSKFLLKFFDLFEKAGERWFALMGGVLMMEAKKVLFAGQVVKDVKPRFKKRLKPAAVGASYKNQKGGH